MDKIVQKILRIGYYREPLRDEEPPTSHEHGVSTLRCNHDSNPTRTRHSIASGNMISKILFTWSGQHQIVVHMVLSMFLLARLFIALY